jgi:transcriptional regulator with XRE-family HTH domain
MNEVKDVRTEQAHPIDVYVGVRVRARRKAMRMSQQELAERLGLTFQQVQKYERGMNRISASKLFEIAQALQVPIAWFFEGATSATVAEGAGPDDSLQAFLSSGEAIDLGQAFLAIPTALQRGRVLDLMRAMSA